MPTKHWFSLNDSSLPSAAMSLFESLSVALSRSRSLCCAAGEGTKDPWQNQGGTWYVIEPKQNLPLARMRVVRMRNAEALARRRRCLTYVRAVVAVAGGGSALALLEICFRSRNNFLCTHWKNDCSSGQRRPRHDRANRDAATP